jgi:hypothetical protein
MDPSPAPLCRLVVSMNFRNIRDGVSGLSRNTFIVASGSSSSRIFVLGCRRVKSLIRGAIWLPTN